jgi:hypothetical protein
VGLADIPFGQAAIGTKRKDKMSDRTQVWLRDMIARQGTLDKGEKKWSIFAPILPIERDLQSWYLEHLLDDMVDKIGGLAIYDAYLLDDLPDQLHHLPRLSFHAPASPHEILRQISLGMDLFTVPFLAEATKLAAETTGRDTVPGYQTVSALIQQATSDLLDGVSVDEVVQNYHDALVDEFGEEKVVTYE